MSYVMLDMMSDVILGVMSDVMSDVISYVMSDMMSDMMLNMISDMMYSRGFSLIGLMISFFSSFSLSHLLFLVPSGIMTLKRGRWNCSEDSSMNSRRYIL